eukprot:1729381-Pyramimonas_sp.AAC.1
MQRPSIGLATPVNGLAGCTISRAASVRKLALGVGPFWSISAGLQYGFPIKVLSGYCAIDAGYKAV